MKTRANVDIIHKRVFLFYILAYSIIYGYFCTRFKPTYYMNSLLYSQNENIGIIPATIFEGLTYQVIFIIDCKTLKLNALSHSKLSSLIKDKLPSTLDANALYRHIVPAEYINKIERMLKSGIRFLHKAGHKAEDFTFHYHTFITRKAKPIRVHHRSVFTSRDNGLQPMTMYTSLSLASHYGTMAPMIRKNDGSVCWEYDHDTDTWINHITPELSDAEKYTLALAAQGMTIGEIASIMCKSTDTVKTYRRSLFEKLGAVNIIQAVSIAQNYHLI